jgi:phosphoglycolate phosphatase
MKLLKKKKLLIFDCDGVLFDSHEANIAYFNSCLKKAEYPPLEKELHHKVVYMSVRQLLNEIMSDPCEADRVFRISQEIDYGPFIPLLVPMFDLDGVLTRLKGQYVIAVATNRGKSLEALFAHFNLESYFSYRISVLEARPKPDPDMLLKCVDNFGVRKSEAVYIGDTMSDYDAATNAGIDYIWVGNPMEQPNISSVEDLLQHLND